MTLIQRMSLAVDFSELFKGRTDAIGSGRGAVERRAVTIADYAAHLRGEGAGIGIFPMMPSDSVNFAAVDLDRPDFEAARAIAELLPGRTWIERSRSGNAHVWVFFSRPAPAWIPRGVMLAALRALGEDRVEVFPKQDRLPPALLGEPTPLGNYINLPFHGDERPILGTPPGEPEGSLWAMYPEDFVQAALSTRQDPEDWRVRAEYLGVIPPERRDRGDREFGTDEQLHVCAEHIIQGALTGERPIREGHRSVVYFNLAKQLLMWERMDEDSAWEKVAQVNAASPDPLPERELHRIFNNAATGRWTSYGCDDPVMAPYVSPLCPIAGESTNQ